MVLCLGRSIVLADRQPGPDGFWQVSRSTDGWRYISPREMGIRRFCRCAGSDRALGYRFLAGKNNREDVHELLVKPILNYNFEVGESFWFFTFTPEVRVNWEQNNNVFLPLKTSIGRLITYDIVVTGGFGIHVVNDYDMYDWQIEMGVSFFF